MNAFAAGFKKYMPLWVLLAVVSGLTFGYFFPGAAGGLKGAVIPLLFVLIWLMIIPTNPKQYVQVLKKPKSLLLGIIFISVLAPLIAYPLAHTILRSNPELGIGLILAATVPPGGLIASWTGLLAGDIALAVSLQAITLVIGIIQIPFTLSILAGTTAQIPFTLIMQTLALIVVMPLLVGAITRIGLLRFVGEKKLKAFSPNFAVISSLIALCVVFISTGMKANDLINQPQLIGIGLVAALGYYLMAYLISSLLCRFMKLDYAQSIPLIYGTGTKNLSIAIALAITAFSNSPYVVLGVVFCFIIQMPLASVFYKVIPRLLGRPDRVPAMAQN